MGVEWCPLATPWPTYIHTMQVCNHMDAAKRLKKLWDNLLPDKHTQENSIWHPIKAKQEGPRDVPASFSTLVCLFLITVMEPRFMLGSDSLP